MTSSAQDIELTIYTVHGLALPMVTVAPGRFRMGDDASEYDDEKPAHGVELKEPFQIGQYPVTQVLWEAVMGNNPSSFKGKFHPVEKVSWQNICEPGGFLDKLNGLDEIRKINAKDGKRFRLPSEAQWEYAARGGKYWKEGYTYAGSNRLEEVGWYLGNSHRATKPVGLKMPNQLGLYDMSGNVWEWCVDIWDEDYKGAPEDGSAWLEGADRSSRVVRGGSWINLNFSCRCAFRDRDVVNDRFVNIGFRLARY